MSAPRTKRQFAGAASDPAQRQITSFFNKNAGSNGSSPGSDGHSLSTTPSSNSPALPAHVQSNLLSVGMRVRKSVPEGYKTGSSYGSFSLWSDADARSNGVNSQFSSSSMAASTSLPRELTPFCGIHKIGGLAVQPETPPSYSFPAATFQVTLNTVPDEDDVPGLTSSQESVASTDSSSPTRLAPPPIYTAIGAVSSTPMNRKRFHIEEEAGEVPGVHSEFRARDASWWDSEISPRSLAPASWNNARLMAFPRRRSRKGAAVTRAVDAASAEQLAELGQENADMTMDGNDFGEAAFLDHRWDEQMDVE